MIVQGCLNGARKRAEHERLPQLVDEIVGDAVNAVVAGANELHIHVHDAIDHESLAPGAVDSTMSALRAALPGTLIGISSGEWIMGDDVVRLRCVSEWSVLPDHASVNVAEAGALEVIRALHDRGIGVEAGLSDAIDAERLVHSGLAPLVLRILIEPDVDPSGRSDADVVSESQAHVDAILSVLARLESPKPILLHGSGASAWPLIERAFASGVSTRVGFEDTLVLPDGSPAASISDLVRAALALRQR